MLNHLTQPLPALLWSIFFLVICVDEAWHKIKGKEWVWAVAYGLLVVLWLAFLCGLLGKFVSEPLLLMGLGVH